METTEWGPWIEWNGGDCPVDGINCELFQAKRADGVVIDGCIVTDWRTRADWGIAAYRLRVAATPEPTTAEIEATQKPCTPESYVADMRADEAAMNAPMLQRDLAEPAAKPQPFASSPREPEPWHQRVAPWTNRFGGWNAEG